MSERSKRRGRNASPVSNYRRMPSRFSPSMGASKRRESETKKRTSNVSYSPYSSQETSRSTKVSYSPPKSEGKIVIPSSNGGYYSTASPFAVPFEGTEDQHITVAVRARPMSEREKRLGALSVVKIKDPNIVGLTKLAQKSNPYLKSGLGSYYEYKFDRAFAADGTQSDVYEQTTQSSIKTVLRGENVTVFAYGATGAGKTYTMFGDESAGGSKQLFGSRRGIIPRAIADLFRQIKALKRPKGHQLRVVMSYLEIYNETIRDLLTDSSTKRALQPREDPVEGVVRIVGLTETDVRSEKEALNLISEGNKRRETATTHANDVSSRSHAVLQIHIRQRYVRPRGGGVEKTYGTLSMIDLAGSERASVTKNRGDRLKEGANINRSLLALANCINTLATNGSRASSRRMVRVKYRDSKLTHLLKSSLEGNCRLVMITCVAPAHLSYEESHNSLKYASRARNIKVRPIAQVTAVMPPPKRESPPEKRNRKKSSYKARLKAYRRRQQQRAAAYSATFDENSVFDSDSKTTNSRRMRNVDQSSSSPASSNYEIAVAREQERIAKRQIMDLQKDNLLLRQKLKASTSSHADADDMAKRCAILENRIRVLTRENTDLTEVAQNYTEEIERLVKEATKPLHDEIRRLNLELETTRKISDQYQKLNSQLIAASPARDETRISNNTSRGTKKRTISLRLPGLERIQRIHE